MTKRVTIRIADVSLAIIGDPQKNTEAIMPAYRPFLHEGKADIELQLHQGIPTDLVGDKIFDCPPTWTLYRHNGKSIIKIYETLSSLARCLLLPSDMGKCELFFADKPGPFTDPLYGPAIELLLVNYLASKKDGLIIHSCGIVRKGRGIMFVGESGAGKSTIARLWNSENDVEVLSDDRIIIRRFGSHFRMYGTPWHGDAKFASPRGAQLEQIFFLKHGHKNAVREIKGIDSVSRFLTASFPPYWDPQGVSFAMDILTSLTTHTPCMELTFKPEKSALNLVKKIIE
ncbi:MAG: hypothetical protein ACMUIP_04690 [bacterium]